MARPARIPAAILALMARGARHAWTLEELHAGLAGAGTATDFSSVFRAAERLAAEGAVHKLLLEDGRACFEAASAHHDHLHCTRCGTLVAVPCVMPRRTLAALEARAGVAVAEHRVVLTGLCPSCRPKRGKKKARA
jgi:Fur family transcriptional regulator, ferric uptake regulator